MTTTTGRTLTALRQAGFLAAVVEKWLPRINRRQDLFGFADVLAVHPRDGVFLLVQTTSIGHVGDRLRKARGRPELAAWLKAGGQFEVWGWNGRKCKRVAVQSQDLAAVVIAQPARKDRYRQRGLFE